MKARALPLAVACLLAITSRTAGQDADLARESLAGLDGLWLVVEKLDDEAQEGGLTSDALQTYLEMRLRQARIPVLSEDEWSASERRSYLYLNVHGLRVVGVWFYRLDLRIKQRACIEGWPEGPEGLLALRGGCSLFTTWDPRAGSTRRGHLCPTRFTETWPLSWINS